MFKLIGGAVVCGFALYGLMTYLERTTLKAASGPDIAAPAMDANGAAQSHVGGRASSLDSAAGAHAVDG